jgi:ADP-L-glycero-D-manno-heptose 6-epimerase
MGRYANPDAEAAMIVVTGAAGMIGSGIVWALNRRGEERILAVDRLGADDRWKNLRGLRFADYLEKDAFLERLRQGRLPADIRAIVHMGACSDTTERDASFLIRNNFEYTKELAVWAVAQDVRFVYASSAATYGDGSRGYDDRPDGLSELEPLNMYGYSKHLFDLWAWRAGLLDRIVGLKYFNVFGPNEYHKGEMRSVVAKAFEQVRATGAIRLFRSHRPEYADGEQRRDFVYLKDAVRMTLFCLDQSGFGGILNVGSGAARSWNELARAVFAALGLPPQIEYIDMPDGLRDRYQYFTEARLERLRAAGWREDATPFEAAVRDYVVNYLAPGAYLAVTSA